MKTKNLMKHMISAVLIAIMAFTCINIAGAGMGAAYGATTKTATVYVTMSVKGHIPSAEGKVMAQVPVKVKAVDGMTTMDAVMEALHKEYKPGGYACDQFVSKLWGIESSNTLFFINNLSITGTVESEPVRNGDYIVASVNGDDKYYSDYFSYFDKAAVSSAAEGSVSLSLKGYMGMMQNAAPEAISNAVVGIVTDKGFEQLDGAVTDKEGKIIIQLDKDRFQAGKTYCLSAKGTVATTATDWNTKGNPKVSVDAPLIAPICKLTVVSKIAAGVKATEITDLKVKSAKGKSVLTWKKTPGYKADAYQIYRSTEKDGIYQRIGKAAVKKYTDQSGLKKGTRYYYKVRGCRKVDGEMAFTKWSQITSAKVK